jgi:hypothetical protein
MVQWMLFLKLSGHSFDALNYMIKTSRQQKETGVHQIDAMTVEFRAKFSCETPKRKILPYLCWGVFMCARLQ